MTIDTARPNFNIEALEKTGVGTITIKVGSNEPLAGTPSLLIKDSANATITSTFISFDGATYTYQATITDTTSDGTATISVVGTDTVGNNGTGSKTFQVNIPRKLIIDSGDNQTGIVSTPLAPFVVKVTDNLDRPIAGHRVTWQIIEFQSAATLSATTTTTACRE